MVTTSQALAAQAGLGILERQLVPLEHRHHPGRHQARDGEAIRTARGEGEL